MTNPNNKNVSANEEAWKAQSNDSSLVQTDTDGLNLIAVANRLAIFMKESGLTVEPSQARTVLSTMHASRVVVLSDTAEMEDFFTQLCLFFGTSVFMDKQTPAFLKKAAAGGLDNVLSVYTEDGTANGNVIVWNTGSSMVNVACNAAQNSPFIHIAVTREGVFPNIKRPPNLWFIYVPQDIGISDKIPLRLAETASVIDLHLRRTKESQVKTPPPRLDFAQFVKLAHSSEQMCAVDETMWKKVDKIEDYANTIAPYSIPNKLWRAIERYISVYIACGGSEAEGIDSALAVMVLPRIMPMIKTGADSDLAFLLEKTLGEGNASAALSAIKYYRRNTK